VNAWLVVAGCAALAATAIAAFFLARKISEAKQRKAVEDARQRMDAVRDNVPRYHTRDRLRNSRF
tara:strand:+ start:4813 stop:5007 length:195 start_codon:yes stop_codon:yes gene_type:complete